MSEDLVKKIRRLLPRFLSRRIPREVKVVEISENESQKLNRIYHGYKKIANVLTFNYGRDYGEILVCPKVIRREAKKQGNTYKYQMTWMILHGILHLVELHHEKSKRVADKVERLERQILEKMFG